MDSAYTLYEDAETVDVNLIVGASPGTDGVTHATNLIDIAEKDVVVSYHHEEQTVVNVTSSTTQTSNNKKSFFDSLSSSSYCVFDSGYKFQFDKFNDVFGFIPLNGDIAVFVQIQIMLQTHFLSWF